jgi:two-component system, OmpR family, phosphate regulon response regulator PhoB
MERLVILVVEDEPEVREAVARDLEVFEPPFVVELAEDVPDAHALMEEITGRGERVALVLADHRLPGTQGTDFLIELNHDPETRDVRKVLLTGQAGLDATIRAVNEADLDHYVAKPWTPEDLHAVVRDQLTTWVIAHGDDLLPYVAVLDAPRLMEALAERGYDR